MHDLAVYVKEGLPFAQDLSLENSVGSYLCFQLALLHPVSYVFFLYRSPSSSLCTIFDSISSNKDELLLINPSANVFVFGDFDVHHKDWPVHFGGTDRLGELCYTFSVSNDPAQIVNFPIFIPDCESHSPALLDLFLFSDASICFKIAFPPPGNSDHVVSVSIDFPSNLYWDAPFHCIAYEYSCADWDSLCNHLRSFERISLNSVLRLLLGNFVSGFRLELMYISIIVIIRSSLFHRHGFQLLLLQP